MDRGGCKTIQPRKAAQPRKRNTGTTRQPKGPKQNGTQASSTPVDAAAKSEIPEIKRSRVFAGVPKYLDERLPPMDSLEDIFQDLVAKALDLGFADVLRRLGDRPLRVATVCSGTESPLLALEMIMQGLRTTQWRFRIEHVFSCEIVAFKQAYIERNFKPPVLFRDLLELGGSEARTAYGSWALIPGNLDILIAGTACVDFSLLNDKRKKLEELGESGSTFFALLKHAERYRPRMIVLENVRAAPWDALVDCWSKVGYAATFFALDTKKYYIPQTRQRGYMVCIDKRCLENEAGGGSLSPQLGTLVSQFARQASSPAGKFLLSEDDIQLEQIERDLSMRLETSSSRSRNSWERYQIRHLEHRRTHELGTQRPISMSPPGGVVCQPPDHFQRQWFKAQVERIWDTLDIKYLIDLSKGVDMISKERFVDLSQGVDRGNEGEKNFGVAGCLTPCGIPFVTSRGRPISGLESIILQGLPKERMILTRESPRELQDLAGNAMTSTVVCAVMLAALIAHHGVLEDRAEPTEAQANVEERKLCTLEEDDSHLSTITIEESTGQSIDQDALRLSAYRSARYCACEKQTRTAKDLVQCVQCGHTACLSCAGNPAHIYKPLAICRKQPLDFVAELKGILPMRLTFEGLSEQAFKEFGCKFPGDSEAGPSAEHLKYIDVVRAVFADEVRFFDIVRAERWTVVYEGERCSLRLSITHDACQWFVFGKPPRTSPARCLLREILAKPIARMTTTSQSLLDGQWEICAPLSTGFWLEITGCGEQVRSHQARCGLMQAVQANSKVWTQIQISVEDADAQLLGVDVHGAYEHLPECGTALGSLYRKPATESSPAVSLFFDPSRYRELQHDSCVLSLEHHRNCGYAPRMTIAELSPCWRALDVKKESSRVRAFARAWQKVSGAALRPRAAENVIYRSLSTLTLVSVGDRDCHQSLVTLVSLKAPVSTLNLSGAPAPWQARGLGRSTELKDLAWVVQKVAAVAGFLTWRPIEVAGSLVCAICQPESPKILWGVNKAGHPMPYEDPKGAAAYERAVKSKPPPFQIFERIGEDGYGELRFVLNIQVLAHSAFSRLVNLGISEDARLSWRLIPNAYDAGREQPARITLSGNKDDIPSVPPPNFRLTLREEQLRSLTWMVGQERKDIEPFIEQETEEATLPVMSWRAEVRAEMPRTIRGGVLADEVGYGKTAIVLALIDAQLEQDRATFNAQEEDPKFIASPATLIVVPPNVFLQWASEIEKFLGKDKYKVVKIRDSSWLARTTVEMIEEADIVLVAWGIFKSDAYFRALRHMTGTPKVPAKGDRNFDSWFTDAEHSLRQLVPVLKDEGSDAYLEEVLKRRRQLKETQTRSIYAPSKRLRGEAFARAQQEKQATQDPSVTAGDPDVDPESHIHEESDDTPVVESDGEPVQQQTAKRKRDQQASQSQTASSDQSKKKKPKQPWSYRQKLNIQKGVHSDLKTMKYPPLHAFRFNRLVLDEFMHIGDENEPKPIALLKLAARSKWILSGTPAIKEFADIKTMAGFLGVHLGVDDDCDAPTRNRRLKTIRKNLTAVEAFRLYQPPRSSAWYAERRNVAQRFVDRFVRQNSPNIDFIPLTDHVILTQQFPAERETYERLYNHLQTQQGSAHRIRNPFDDPLIGRLNRFLGDQSECSSQIALVKSAVTADLRDLAWSIEDCEKKIETFNQLIAERWDKLGSLIKQVVHAWREWSVDPSLWMAFLDDVFTHDFGDQDATDEAKSRLQNVFGSYEDWEGTEEESLIEVQVAERFKKAKAEKPAKGRARSKAATAQADVAMNRAPSPIDDFVEISDTDSAIIDAALDTEEGLENEDRVESEELPESEGDSDDESDAKPPPKKAKSSGKTAKPKKEAKKPTKRARSTKSTKSDKQAKPDTPDESENPDTPDKPDEPDKPAVLSASLAKEKKEASRQAKERPVRKKLLTETVAGVRKVIQAFRDVRFFTTMQDIQIAQQYQCLGCHEHFHDITKVNVVRSCGHLLCTNCIAAIRFEANSQISAAGEPAGDLISIEKRRCRVPGCHGSTETSMLVAGSSVVDTNAASESAKLAAMISVIQQTADEELVLLFVQFMDLISVASRALKSANIEHRIAKTGRDAKIIDEFISAPTSPNGDGSSKTKAKRTTTSKADTTSKSVAKSKAFVQEEYTSESEDEEMPDADTPQGPRPKVLILPVGTSMAAGLNLQAINHVIFLSPLVLPEQSEWDSGMTQAIGRVRRYGQKRTVHVWHLISEGTADITILKEREENRINEKMRRTLVMRGGSPMLVELREDMKGEVFLEGPSLAFAKEIEFE